MSPINATDATNALTVRLNQTRLPKGCRSISNCVVKTGPQTYKTVSLLTFGDQGSDEVTKRELRVQSWNAKSTGTGIDFNKTEHAWHCVDEEIDKLLAFLSGEVSEPGRYRRVRSGSANQIIDAIESGTIQAGDIETVVSALLERPGTVEELAKSDPGERLAGAVQVARHSRTLDDLDALLENPKVTEPMLQSVLEKDWWIFGGKYIDKASRRSITVLDQLDVPLLRSDGVLHIVELKAARVPNLVLSHRNHVVVGPEVNIAVGQVMNYLRSLDEQRDTIFTSLGIDCRRAFATVVIGDERWVSTHTKAEVREAMRTYNSHLARIEVITYSDLLRDSRSALSLQGGDGS